ncbi:MAG: Rieske (2Fe-2S) protein [Myxococcales bacterium]|nr:Rieske (2Fe-2S) protein [Myxococcales bacterium]
MAQVTLCRADELQDGRCTVFLDDGDAVLVIRFDGRLYALDGHCPHQYAPLEGGTIENGILECPLHGWRFRLDDGQSPDMPMACVRTYRVAQVDGAIVIER